MTTRRSIVLVLVPFALACSSKPKNPELRATALEILAPAQSPYAGSDLQLTARATMSDGSSKDVTNDAVWATSAPAVAALSGHGGLHAVAQGSVRILAAYGGLEAWKDLSIDGARIASLLLAPGEASIKVGESLPLAATALYTDGAQALMTQGVAWASSATDVATVSDAGIVQGLKPGKASISAGIGNSAASMVVTVTAAPAPELLSIVADPASVEVVAGSCVFVKLIATYSDQSTADVATLATWASDDEAVASVGPGVVYGNAAGATVAHAAFGSFSVDIPVTVGEAVPAELTITPESLMLARGTHAALAATLTLSDGTSRAVEATWSSGNAFVASVDASGNVTAREVGYAIIEAAYGDLTASASVEVTGAELVSVQITPGGAAIAFTTDQQYTLTAMYSDGSHENVTGSSSWTSSDETVATVSGMGLAHGVAPGTTVITATYGGRSDHTTLTVTDAVLVSLSVTPVQPMIAVGTTWQFTATGIFSDDTTQDLTKQVTWDSDRPDVATVDSAGVATGVSPGFSNISATRGSMSDSTRLTVTSAKVVAIDVSPAGTVLAVGTKERFTAQAIFDDFTYQDVTTQVTWASSAADVATIDGSGTALAVSPGTTDISASVFGLTGSQALTVTSASIVGLSVSPAELNMPVGLSKHFVATAALDDGTTQDVTISVGWASSDTSVAVVSNSAPDEGLATALKPGVSTISASLNGYLAEALMTVSDATIDSITVTPENARLVTAYYLQFTATATYSDGSMWDVTNVATWKSSNTNSALIWNESHNKGLVWGGAATPQDQPVTISATWQGVTGSTFLTVTHAKLVTIEVTPNPATVQVLRHITLKATGTFDDGSVLDVTNRCRFTSSDKSVAYVHNGDGMVTGLAAGEVTISVERVQGSASVALTVTP